MKIAIAQISTDPTFLENNVKKIKEYIDKSENTDIVIFPELTISGYIPLDLILDDLFIDKNLKYLEEIVDYTENKNITVVVGFIDYSPNKRPDGKSGRYNSLAVIKDGHIVAKRHKTLFPDYDIFFEKRYFDQNIDESNFNTLNGYEDLNSDNIANNNIAFLVCEDIWDENYNINPINEVMKNNTDIDLLITSNASPFSPNKTKTRQDVLSKVFKRCQCPIIYVNRIGLIDGYEGHVVFDGNSLIMDSDGKIIFKGKAFEEELFIFDTEKEYEEINIEENEIKEIHDALVLGIKDYCRMSNFKGALIGLSGGIDSAVVAALATEALGKDNVIGITMPSHVTGEETRKDAELLANNFGITIYTNPIKDIFDILVNSLKTSSVLSDVKDLTLQNIQARVRGNLLMAVSNDTGKILLTTGNKTEIALGYFTLYGDSCGGMAVIGDVNKLQVYALANYINEKNGKELIPQTTITRPPTAELTTGQTDENSLGVPYDILSPLVEDIIENGKTIEELKEKYDNDLINKIIKLINTAEYKRRQIAPSIRVSNKAFGCGRRVPINICN